MTSFDPFRPEVERAWVRLRGKQIAERTGCSPGIGEAEAMCELRKLRETGAPMPWSLKVVPMQRRTQDISRTDRRGKLQVGLDALGELMMPTDMPDDGLGPWNVAEIDGLHVLWRRRPTRAQDLQVDLGGTHVLDISINGAPPVTQHDFNDNVPDQRAELELRVRLLKG